MRARCVILKSTEALPTDLPEFDGPLSIDSFLPTCCAIDLGAYDSCEESGEESGECCMLTFHVPSLDMWSLKRLTQVDAE